mgnify:CR=1 FL=1
MLLDLAVFRAESINPYHIGGRGQVEPCDVKFSEKGLKNERKNEIMKK